MGLGCGEGSLRDYSEVAEDYDDEDNMILWRY